jgi:conjugal transfer/entry exclusion protein
MSSPSPDTSEFAALLDFVATGGRAREQLKASQNGDQLAAQMLAPRARAMTTTLLAIAKAVLGRPH